MNALGKHLILELKDCAPETLLDASTVERIMLDAATESKATIIGHSFHNFNPFGVSGMIIIAESHLSIHTWPEYNYAAVDIFTCGEIIDPQVAAEYLIKHFKSKNPMISELKRGILYLDGREVPHKINNEWRGYEFDKGSCSAIR